MLNRPLGMTEVDEFKLPNRKPWVFVVLVVVLLLIVTFNRVRLRGRAKRERAETKIEQQAALAPAAVERPGGAAVRPAGPAQVRLEAPEGVLARGEELERAGDLAGARAHYLDLLARYPASSSAPALEERLGRIGIELVMTPRPMPEKTLYVVASGDSVARIAQKFGTTAELIVKGNGIRNANLIRAGDRLSVVTKPFAVQVSKTRRDLVLTLDGRFFKRYRVGTGMYGKTPVGAFVVADRIAQPTWWRPDGKSFPFGHKENILGTHWLSIRATGSTPPVQGYGLHGTWDDASIGKAESAGCVRMLNAEIEELYTLLPVGTPVTIEE